MRRPSTRPKSARVETIASGLGADAETEHPQPPPEVEPGAAHASRTRQVPSPQLPSAPQKPTAWSMKQGPASGGINPPQGRCTTQRRTDSHTSPRSHIASLMQTGRGEQMGPLCEEPGLVPAGQSSGGGSTTSARAAVGYAHAIEISRAQLRTFIRATLPGVDPAGNAGHSPW